MDEVAKPNADDTARGLALAAERGRPFERGNRAAENRKPALCALGVPLAASDSRYVGALRKAKRYVERRRREMAVMHGGTLGAGPCAMLASAGRSLAASVLLHELASEKLDPALFVQASRLADSARQQELTAVALAEREAQARAAQKPTKDVLAAFLVAVPGESAEPNTTTVTEKT